MALDVLISSLAILQHLFWPLDFNLFRNSAIYDVQRNTEITITSEMHTFTSNSIIYLYQIQQFHQVKPSSTVLLRVQLSEWSRHLTPKLEVDGSSPEDVEEGVILWNSWEIRFNMKNWSKE